jgi:hypothetical protein
MLSQHFANKFGDSFFFLLKFPKSNKPRLNLKINKQFQPKSNKQEEEELQTKNSFNPSTQYSSNKHQNA